MNAYMQNYLGSDGLFVAIILAILVAASFGWLTRKDIKLKLPDSVPPMVADSLSPAFTAMIIFAAVFFIKSPACLLERIRLVLADFLEARRRSLALEF